MTLKAATGINASFLRGWVSRVAPRPAAQPANSGKVGDSRLTAERRAAAAEIIAKEANAVRLRALLAAAREQAVAKSIHSAEARFAAAKGEWETARRGLDPEPDPYAEPVAPEPELAGGIASTRAARSTRTALSLGGCALVALVGSVGIALHMSSMPQSVAEDDAVARPAIQALGAPAKTEPALQGPEAMVIVEPELRDAAELAPAVKRVPRIQPAAAVRTMHRQRVVPPPPPPRRPEAETPAKANPTSADPLRATLNVE